MRTQVAIIGAGPAGLTLAHLLHRSNIDSVIIENRSREYVIERVRAGVLEQATVDLMVAAGLGNRLQREGMRHEGVHIAFKGQRHRIDCAELTGGRAITIYGQNELVKDLIEARLHTGAPSFFESEDVTPCSGWWACAAERGGGIACWLETIRAAVAAAPRRTVHFTRQRRVRARGTAVRLPALFRYGNDDLVRPAPTLDASRRHAAVVDVSCPRRRAYQ